MERQLEGDSDVGKGGQTTARHTPDAGADFLDRRHQRVRYQHRPKQRVAELRTHLGVGRNATRVIIGCSGDIKPRPGTSIVRREVLRCSARRLSSIATGVVIAHAACHASPTEN